MNGFTPAQERAIAATGNVLVVAGAGAGKTRTLVERCLAWLLRDEGNSLDQILMVTFTDAAAMEMRQRIRVELTRRVDADPGNLRLAEQLALLDTARISTLHSFCLELVRQHFYELEIDPQITVLPEEEAQLMAEEVLSSILERHYAGGARLDQEVKQLIQTHARGWDRPVRQLVLQIHHYTQTLPDPEAWMEEQRRRLDLEDPVHWREWLRVAVSDWCADWLPALEEEKNNPKAEECADLIRRVMQDPGLDGAARVLSEIVTGKDKNWPAGKRTALQKPLKEFFEEAEFLESLFGKEADDPLVQDWQWVRPVMATLLELVAEFTQEFSREKQELGRVDFHDLEQFSLRLLWDSKTNRPKPLAEYWRQKLRLVFVDEYQDINAAQDAILTALARDGTEANRFLVGDVKQSIYRFRLAAPRIFQEYARTWRQAGPGSQVIPLSENFRSHEAILEVINRLFAGLMRSPVGGVDYDEESRLRFGDREGRATLTLSGCGQAEDAGGNGEDLLPPVEFHLRLTGSRAGRAEAEEGGDEAEGNGGSDGSGRVGIEWEARMIGLRLWELRQGACRIWDAAAQSWRAPDWKDMVILLRSPRYKVESFAKEFASLGIPLLASRGGFFETPEIMDLLSLLALLDNPLQDVPLLAVLRSPIVGLSANELATIRLASKGRFWTALQAFHREAARLAETEPESPAGGGVEAFARSAWPKVDLFLRRFKKWRRCARENALSQCLDQILSETQYAAWLLTFSRGEQRQANLTKLLSWARQFNRPQRHGLFQFLQFVEAQKKMEIDHEPALLETENAVRLMSIHQSKGLEFPVVVAADLGKRFNFAELTEDIILDEVYGLCPQVKPPSMEQRYPSLPHWLARRRQRRDALGEEMRLLYVAMTRACQKLILVGTTSKTARERWTDCSVPLPVTRVVRSSSCLDWLGPAMREITGDPEWLKTDSGRSPCIAWRVYSEGGLGLPPDRREGERPAGVHGDLTAAEWARLREKLGWQYPHRGATAEPAKTSVSEFRRRLPEDPVAEPHAFVSREAPAWGMAPVRRREVEGADLGTAHHLFLQFVPLDRVQSREQLRAEAEKMERAGMLSGPERSALDIEAILKFWQGPVGERILREREHLHRELPFTVRASFEELRRLGWAGDGAAQGEFVILQGVVDMAVIRPEEIWILDFKTDRVTPETVEERLRLHAPQLGLYGAALSAIYQRPVTNRWVHFLSIDRTMEV